MIKLPDEISIGITEGVRHGIIEGKPINPHRADGWNACIAEVQRLNATSQPVSDENSRVAEALESLLWPNMAIGNKAIILAAINSLRAAPSRSVSDDTRRMDYLVSKVVNVRQPLRYGSHSILWSQAITDEEDDHYESKLREQIDAMLETALGDQNEQCS